MPTEISKFALPIISFTPTRFPMLKQFSRESEKTRLEAFIDAILAIIMTILVLEFKVPEEAFDADSSIHEHLIHLLPSFLSYIISFSTIVILWLDHHNLFRVLKKADVTFALLNFLFILFLSATPFTTALGGRNYDSAYAIAIMAGNYLLMNVSFSAIWFYVLGKKLLDETEIMQINNKPDNAIILIGILLQLASIPLAFVNTVISFILFFLVLILHFYRLLKH